MLAELMAAVLMAARPRGLRLALACMVVLGATLLVALVVLTPWDPLPGARTSPADVNDFFTPAQIARSESFFDSVKWASWINLALGVVLAVVLGFTSAGRLLVAWVRTRFRRWWLQVVVLTTFVVVAGRALSLPGSAWIHHVSSDYGLSTQSWGDWLLDLAKSLGISVLVSAIGMLALVGLARRFTRGWFIPASLAAAAVVIVSSFAYPVVIEPVFNTFTPLPAGQLRTRLLDLAERDGVEVSDVLVADASRRTTALNAYVSGFGSTKRIVIYDTLLDTATNRDIELVVAHELGHATRDDVLVGTAEGALAAALAIIALYVALRSTRLRRPVGVGSAGDPAVTVVVLALVTIVGLVVMPVANTVSRQVEARADAHALDLTADPRAFIHLQQRLAVANLSHLTPNPVLSFWFSTHPTTLDRIGMALAWERLHAQER